MVLKRRSTRRKPMRRFKGRKVQPVRILRSRFRRTVNPSIHVKEKFMISGIAAGVGSNGAVNLDLIDTTQLGAYASLYASYKITGIKYTFLPFFTEFDYNQATSNAAGGVVYGGRPHLWYRINRLGAVVPTSENEMIMKNDSKCIMLGHTKKPFSVYVSNPRFDVDAGTVGGNLTFKTGYLPINDTDENHYGLEWWLENPTGSGSTPYDVLVTLYINFRTPK